MHGIADNDSHNGEAATKSGQRTQIFALVVPPRERQHGLCCEPQFVGDGHADAAIADIEAEIAGMSEVFQFAAPALQLTALSGLLERNKRGPGGRRYSFMRSGAEAPVANREEMTEP
jgi:hypothetical protein